MKNYLTCFSQQTLLTRDWKNYYLVTKFGPQDQISQEWSLGFLYPIRCRTEMVLEYVRGHWYRKLCFWSFYFINSETSNLVIFGNSLKARTVVCSCGHHQPMKIRTSFFHECIPKSQLCGAPSHFYVQFYGNEIFKDTGNCRASSSYFFLFFPIFLSILLFFLFFSNFLLFFLFFSHFTYNKQIFVGDLNILSLFKYVVYRVH